MSQELNDSSTFEKQLASETIPMLLTTPVSATESEGVDMDGSDSSVGVQHKKPKEGEETSEVKDQDVKLEVEEEEEEEDEEEGEEEEDEEDEEEEVGEEDEAEEEPEEEHYEGYYLIEDSEADDSRRAYRAMPGK
jgi:hypothetical protein